MIITNVCLLLEALSIVICLHHLYGEKFRLDIATVSFLSIDMIIMTAINYFGLPKMYLFTMIIYPIIALYCGIRFGFKLKAVVWNVVLCVIIVGGIQILGLLFVYCYSKIQNFSDYKLLITNSMTFAIVLTILPIFKVERLSKFSQDNGKIIILVIGVCLTWISFWVFSYKNIKAFELKETMMLFISIVLVLMLADQLGKYKLKAKEIETELKVNELYSESFRGLIENIRQKQHEFDNHINAIYSLHFSCRSFEELVNSQNDYCEHLIKENHFNRLLAPDNSVIRGFLYTRFVEIDKKGIDVSYKVIMNKMDIGVPIFKLIEILGNLINNAVEALEIDNASNKLHLEIVETNVFFIEVRNESPYVAYSMLEDYFKKGYSKKGENRGLGLYNVKQICERYGLEIASEWTEIDGKGWLLFKVWK